MVIMDFSKAFDVVPHNLLLHKLQHLGITGNTLKWIRSFLIDRHQQVVVDGKHSSKAPSPQEFLKVQSLVPFFSSAT